MHEHIQPIPAPSRDEVEAKLTSLIEGRSSREEVASWAEQWVLMDDPPVDDPVVWDLLGALAGADMITTDRPYLFVEDDFRDWLEELRKS